MLKGGADGKRLLADGLSRYRTCMREIEESDLEGAEAGWIESSNVEVKLGLKPPPIFLIRLLDRDKSSIVMKKLRGGEGTIGWALNKNKFELGSPLHGINVVLVSHQEHPDSSAGHELLHIIYDEKSKSRSDIRGLFRAVDYDDERCCEISSLYVESSLCGEILAHAGHWYRDEEEENARQDADDLREYLKVRLKLGYAPDYAEFFADNVDKAETLPDSGIVSRHMARDTVKNCMANYLGEKVDEAMDAFRTLSGNLPSSQVLRIAASSGPTKEEISSGKYIGPIDELVLWSKHYKEVLAPE